MNWKTGTYERKVSIARRERKMGIQRERVGERERTASPHQGDSPLCPAVMLPVTFLQQSLSVVLEWCYSGV